MKGKGVKNMKSMKSLIVTLALFLWACSEDSKSTTGVWVDDPSIAFGDSSSSLLTDISSSSSVDIAGYGDDPVVFPPNTLCEPTPLSDLSLMKAPKKAPQIIEDETYGVIPAITKERVKVLVSEGLTLDSAIAQARGELFKELGLDTLLEDKKIRESSLERTLYYVYQYHLNGEIFEDEYPNMAVDFADGKLDLDGNIEEAQYLYCLENATYEGLAEAYKDFMPMGCWIAGYVYEDPYAIFSNIKRKCEGLPYCNEDVLGMFSADSTIMCKKNGWRPTSFLDRETAGRLCEKEGDYVVSTSEPSRSYVCHLDKGWDSTTTLSVEMADVKCEKAGSLYKSKLDPDTVYICRDSMLVSEYWEEDRYDYEIWDYATPFEAEMEGVPCDELGKLVASVVRPDSFHICKDGIWNKATRLEWETDGVPCDREEKIFDSPKVPGLYYVCQEGEWKRFYETSCTKNNERKLVTDEEASWIQLTYICYEGKWYSSVEWTTDLPYEYYFNPDIDYGSFKDPRDGRVYRTVEYRGVTWMSENMKYYDPTDVHLKGQIACLEDGCANTGYYYSSAAADYVCPEGWTLLDTAIIRNITDYAEYPYYEHYYSSIAKIGSAYNYKDDYGLSFLATGLIAGENLDQPGWLGYATMFWLTEVDETNVHYIGDVKPGHEPGPTKFEDVWGVTTTNMHLPIRCIKK